MENCNPIGKIKSIIFLTKRQVTTMIQRNCNHTFITYNTKKGMVTRCSKCNYKQRITKKAPQ